MAKYLLLSDSPFIPTGFRNQTFLLAERLAADGNDVHWLAPSHIGSAVKGAILPDGRKCNFTVHPGTGRHPHALDILGQRLGELKPDIFYCLLDTFMLLDPRPNIFDLQIPVPSTYWNPFKSAMWYPSDGGYFPFQCELVLKKFDFPVAMSKWGQIQVKNQFGMNTEYIPHGVKTNLFYPLNDEQKLKLRVKWSKKLGFDLTNKFIIGCVARNQPRKHMDRVLKSMSAFSHFAKNNQDAILLLHCDPNDPAQVFPLKELAKRYRIENRVVYTNMSALQGTPDDEMYEIYNLFDVKLDTTSGEGFGVTLIESMACGVPIIVTDYTTTKEIVTDNNAGLGIRLTGEKERLYDGKAESEITNQVVGGWGVERGISDNWHAKELLEQCYNDWKTGGKLLKEMGANGRKAVLRDYDFDSVVYPKWKALFKRMLE